MILYTSQGFNLETFREPIDRARGAYRDWPIISSAIGRIGDLLETDQFLWASLKPLGRYGGKSEYRFDHKLDVSPADILAVVSGWLWHLIIEGEDSVFVPDHVHRLHADIADRPNLAEHRQWLATNKPADPWVELLRPFKPSKPLEHADDLLIRWPFSASTRIIDVAENERFHN